MDWLGIKEVGHNAVIEYINQYLEIHLNRCSILLKCMNSHSGWYKLIISLCLISVHKMKACCVGLWTTFLAGPMIFKHIINPFNWCISLHLDSPNNRFHDVIIEYCAHKVPLILLLSYHFIVLTLFSDSGHSGVGFWGVDVSYFSLRRGLCLMLLSPTFVSWPGLWRSLNPDRVHLILSCQ